MIKMYINNEEVVSNKEFTISEEMLATPSTVLNNCYPALWENTKDYVSKFYFPKDYSKCIIGDGEFEKGSQRNIIKKVSGISPSFETNITKPWESLTIDGKSTQETRSGKNLFKPLNITNNGITTTYDKNGIGTIKGTSTNKWVNISSNVIYSYPAGNYVLSIDKPKTFNVTIKGTYTDKEIFEFPIFAGSKTKNVAFKKEVYSMYAYISGFEAGATFNETIKIQLEKGSTATEYEPYGASPSPDYPSEIENVKGRNLFDKDNANIINTYLINDGDGTLPSDGGERNNCIYIPCKSNTTYTIQKMEGKRFKVGYTYSMPTIGGNVYGKIGANNDTQITITTNSQAQYLIVYLRNGNVSGEITLQQALDSLQIEKGSKATSYLPYNTIEVKSTGKNLFDIKDWLSTLGATYTENSDGSITFTPIAALYKTTYLIKETDRCMMSFKIKNGNGSNFRFRYVYEDGAMLETSGSGTETSEVSVATSSSVSTAHGKVIGIRGNWTIAGTFTIKECMLEQFIENVSPQPYEPYKENITNINLKENELCSLPNGTKDELIVKDGRAKIIKRIGKVVLDGSEGWNMSNGGITTTPIYKYFDNNDDKTRNIAKNSSLLMCNYFEQKNIWSKDNIGINYEGTATTKSIRIRTNITTVDEFKTWLSTHNTIVQYELKEPYEIDLGEVTLPNTLIGQNNVTLDATLETNMEISYYYSSYDLLFAGVVKKTGNISLNPRYPHYADIQVLDFKTFLSEGETLNFVIDNKTIGQAIDMVIDAIKSYGFVKGNIMLDDINEVIGAYSTDKKTAYDVFQYFSDITNSRWFTRMIDEDTVAIDFYDTDKLPVKPKIEYTEDWFCNNLIDDMSYSIKTDDYRNKQILLSDEVFGSTPYNDLLTSNGYDTSYTTTGKIASLTSAKIDGKNATFTTEANKEGGVEADIYYKPGEVGITTNNQIGAGKVIEITYIPLVEGREIIINDEEVNRIGSQLNRNGVISRYENRNDTTSSDELRQIGQTYIKYKGKAEVTLKITSRKNIYDIGDKVQFDAPLEDLSTEYMVKKKTTKYIVTTNQLFYDYELSSSFNSESEINYFDNQRSKHKGNLSEDDYITRDIDITNSANIIWHDTSIDEISITGNNILDCALDSPFTD